LQSAHFKTRTYETALAFLNALPDIPSGCIVTDVKMPEMSGVELLRHLRKINLRMPVIIITGHADVPMAVDAMKSGASDFLEKPFDDEVLLSAVRAALASAENVKARENEKAELQRRFATLSKR